MGVFDLSVLNDDDLDNRVRLADYVGTPTVVNFFASWCFICEEELPAFRRVERELGDDAEGTLVETIFAPFDDAQLMDQLSTLGFVS